MQFERNNAQETVVYEIMHMEKVMASVSTLRQVQIFIAQFLPYDINL